MDDKLLKFEEKVTLVTGGARGIGNSIAKAFAKQNSKVVVVDIKEELGLETII